MTIALPAVDPVRLADSPRRPIIQGGLVFLIFFVGFGGWLTFAPLTSAIIGPAAIRVEAHRQAVQHVDGGVIREILVREGDLVQEGDVLLRLDDVALRANAEVLSSQKIGLQLQLARLVAERDGKIEIDLPQDIQDRFATPSLSDAVAAQRALLASRIRSLQSQTDVHRKRISQLREQLTGYTAQLGSAKRQAGIATDERAGLNQLLEKGYVSRTRVLGLDREIASLEGRVGDLASSIARAHQQIAESEAEIERLTRERAAEVSQQLRDAQSSLLEVGPRLAATLQMLSRVELRSPRAGHVVGLAFFNPGAVIRGGDRILDIVPNDSLLVVEARIRPEDIDEVRIGMKAEVRMTGLNRRITPVVDGEILTISADRLLDPRSAEPYFEVIVRLDDAGVASLRSQLVSGMPALAMFPTRERTPLDYLLKPLLDGYDRALRE